MHRYFELVNKSNNTSLGQIRLLSADVWGECSFDATSLADIAKLLPLGNFSEASVHEDSERGLALYLYGYELFKLIEPCPVEAPSASGCKTCGHPGSFIRMSLVCPVHMSIIGGL